ncbi:MAG: penicillin acylase family protein [Pseudomonadota bacterium]|nr:penicillin acylase family protein [Pseudomonadota bacterium]
MPVRLLLVLALSGCKVDEAKPVATPSPLLDVPETASFTIPGLTCDAQVVRTAGNVPHIYAKDRVDLARAYGFTQARDRYFEMELARRLGLGTLSEILGDAALGNDMDSRATGMTHVADTLLANLPAEHEKIFDGFAEGVNAYLAQVRTGDLPLPSELEIAGPFLGVTDPTELLVDWTRRDLAGVAAVLVYELGYETDDVGRAYTDALVAAGLFDTTDPLGALRQAGVEQDIWAQITPVWPYASAPGWGLNGAGATSSVSSEAARAPTGSTSARRLGPLAARLEAFERRLGRGDHEAGWGSNVWAVGAGATADGSAVVAGDGHLPLSVPSLFWQVGLDTRELGGGDTHQMGLGIPGLPIMAVGTNGDVAWSQTQLMGDITDWYTEQVQLGSDGMPAATLFQGTWEPMTAVTESHTIADVPLLGSVGRSFSWSRYTTFDGRWLAEIEGTAVEKGTAGAVVFPDGAVLPGDTDGDGIVSAVTFDYTAFSDGNLLNAVDRFGHSANVEEVREATKYLVAYSQNIGVADSSGSVLYTGYQAVPCRGYLPRDADGRWPAGADPTRLLDGTTYGGFEIPVAADGMVDESQGADPSRCVVPFEDYPAALDPTAGFIVNGNNDPGSITLDNDLWDEPWYIGGPWVEGWRAWRIAERIEEQIAAGTADEAGMAAIQGDHQSALGTQFGGHLVDAIVNGRAAAATGELNGAGARIAALYLADAEAFDEVESRVSAWLARGAMAESGVQTFYHSPTAEQIDDSVATMLFNAWLAHWDDRVFDESLPSVWNGGSTAGKTRALTMFLAGRGTGNPGDLASWNAETGESVFFDAMATTDVVETSDEVALQALGDALTFLRSAPSADLRGSGFGTTDMSGWKWGLRHWTRFESVLADFVDAEEFSFLTDTFSVNTDVLPLEGEAGTESFEWFPRPGDNLAVDAANSGWGTDFTHGSGPVFRMVIALGPDGRVSGRNVIPGGQSSMIDTPYFSDQAALWLANDTMPLLFSVEDVVAGATARERLIGAGACD